MREKIIVLYAFFALLALGLLFLSLSRYQFYQKYIDISRPLRTREMQSRETQYKNADRAAPSTDTDNVTGQKIDVNSADIYLLMRLPGIGRETALHVIEYRNRHGDFTNVDDLIEVSGIGIKKLEKLRDCVIIR